MPTANSEMSLDAMRMALASPRSLYEAGMQGGDSRPSIQNQPQTYMEGVGERIMHPLDTLAEEAQRWGRMDPSEVAAQFGGAGMAGIIKPKGGNWLNKSVDDFMGRQYSNSDIDKWVKTAIPKYIRNEMGTEGDRVRALAEQGITHSPPRANIADDAFVNLPELLSKRSKAGFPEPRGISQAARGWESVSDEAITSEKASQQSERTLREEPWLSKLPPDETVYGVQEWPNSLGFNHVVDVLQNKLADGTLRPESLSRMAFHDAVRMTHAANQEAEALSRKMEDEGFAGNLQLPVIHEYPSGHSWRKLPSTNTPEGLKKVQEVGCAGGWCTQGKAAALKYGGDSELHVLIDSTGRPHVQNAYQQEVNHSGTPGIRRLAEMKPFGNSWESQRVKEWMEKNPEYRNELIPMMQDYVRKGAFDEHADLANAGLFELPLQTMQALRALQRAGHDVSHALTAQGDPRVVTAQERDEISKLVDLRFDWLTLKPKKMKDGGWVESTPDQQKMANGGWVEPSMDVQRMTTHN